jgi:hypothetical protein
MSVVGFFRRGGKIIPIMKKTGIGRLGSAQKAYSKAKSASKALRSKVSGLYKQADDLMAVSKKQKELRYIFPNERVSGLNEAESIRTWYRAKTIEGSGRYKSLSNRAAKTKEYRNQIAKRAAVEVGALGALGAIALGSSVKRKKRKKI